MSSCDPMSSCDLWLCDLSPCEPLIREPCSTFHHVLSFACHPRRQDPVLSVRLRYSEILRSRRRPFVNCPIEEALRLFPTAKFGSARCQSPVQAPAGSSQSPGEQRESREQSGTLVRVPRSPFG